LHAKEDVVAGKTGGKRLVIVESPTKVKTIAGYLGDGYVVESSRGHVRDLPTGAAEVPAKYKGEKWARTGIDVDNGFEPIYVVSPDKRAIMRTLKDALAGSDELLLATDDDREGEAIAWHLLQELKPTRVSWTPTRSTRRRPAASSTGCTATRSRRCCGRR
jgi:DNA topoisomerase-1